ncbi:hypothetical protein [Actomonas aquatica]|uniref:PEP-CTERM protein-sorting domain-containing protein n=1 Tax=Actomonas aquatica TaxID=2866162 RepID=A0ABZ1C7Y8_9BACT|nr:hypothetical protein [Opitutus sp. WL0086]WRQ87745.1 hypothetical protein K1X11_023280 [Opitutus sp. WL0086]
MKTLSSCFLHLTGLATLGVGITSAQFDMPTGVFDNEISFVGSAATNGVSGYQGPDAATTGHTLISDNAPSGTAYHFVAGRPYGPDPDGSTFASQADGASGFTSFQLMLGTQGYTLSDVTIHFGPNSSNFENSWNLGQGRNGLNSSTGALVIPAGVLGVDHEYEAWTGSSVEDRFYAANPTDVFYYIAINGIRAIDVGYADLYMRIDYGSTSAGGDDIIQAYHTVSGVRISAGVNGMPEYTIADAFVNDVSNAGGGIQVIIDSVQAAVTGAYSYNGKVGSHFAIDGRLAAVPLSAVPEPGTYAAWAAAGAFGFVLWHRRRQQLAAVAATPEPVTQP